MEDTKEEYPIIPIIKLYLEKLEELTKKERDVFTEILLFLSRHTYCIKENPNE